MASAPAVVILTLSKIGKALISNPVTKLLDVFISQDDNNTLTYGSDNGLFVLGNAIPTLGTIASAETITPGLDTNGNIVNQYSVTALAVAAIIEPPIGTPVDGQKLIFRFKDNGIPQLLSFTDVSGGYRVVGGNLPSSTIAGKVLYIGCIYNAEDVFWDIIAVAEQ